MCMQTLSSFSYSEFAILVISVPLDYHHKDTLWPFLFASIISSPPNSDRGRSPDSEIASKIHFSAKTSKQPYRMCKRDVINVILYQDRTLSDANTEDFECAEGAILVELEMQQIRCMFALERKHLWHEMHKRLQQCIVLFGQGRNEFVWLDSELFSSFVLTL